MPIVLGYHGCSLEVARSLLSGAPFEPSTRSYDWLGSGVYFWEDDPLRAYEWAVERARHQPTLIGAVIDLGRCLDLTKRTGLRAVQQIYLAYSQEQSLRGLSLPINEDYPRGVPGDLARRHLDRAVINYLNETRARLKQSEFQSVRALFPEGKPLYPNAGFRELTHIQLCVRDSRQILGVFRIPEHQQQLLKLPALYGSA